MLCDGERTEVDGGLGGMEYAYRLSREGCEDKYFFGD